MADQIKEEKMSKAEKLQRLVLLESNLVEIYDPIVDAKVQIDLDTAKRLAKVRPDIAKVLQELEIEL